MDNKIEKIKELCISLKKYSLLSEEDLIKLIKEFEKIPRDEYYGARKQLLADDEIIDSLLDIGSYTNNKKLKENVISSLGYIIQKYEYSKTDKIFNFFTDDYVCKKPCVKTAFFIPHMPQFKEWDKKWEYLLAIKNMTPKKIALKTFDSIISLFLEEIPKEHLSEIRQYFETQRAEKLQEYEKREDKQSMAIDYIIGEIDKKLDVIRKRQK